MLLKEAMSEFLSSMCFLYNLCCKLSKMVGLESVVRVPISCFGLAISQDNAREKNSDRDYVNTKEKIPEDCDPVKYTH